MCFGSTTNTRSVSAAAKTATTPVATRDDIVNAIDKVDDEYVRAGANKKGKRTEDAFDVLGTLLRAMRDNEPIRAQRVLSEYAVSLR